MCDDFEHVKMNGKISIIHDEAEKEEPYGL